MPSINSDGSAGNRTTKVEHRCCSIRLNLTLNGEVARILFELRRRGIVRSYADCVNQAILLLHKEITKQDLRIARLKALQNNFQEYEGE